MLRVIFDTNIYGELLKEKDVVDIEQAIMEDKEFLVYGYQPIRKEIRDIPATYTYWDPQSDEPHPEKFTYTKMKRYKRKICKSKAIFGRKFYPKAARKLALTCGK